MVEGQEDVEDDLADDEDQEDDEDRDDEDGSPPPVGLAPWSHPQLQGKRSRGASGMPTGGAPRKNAWLNGSQPAGREHSNHPSAPAARRKRTSI